MGFETREGAKHEAQVTGIDLGEWKRQHLERHVLITGPERRARKVMRPGIGKRLVIDGKPALDIGGPTWLR